MVARKSSGESTSAGRCRVTRTYLRGSRSNSSQTSSSRAAPTLASSVSIIVLPTKRIRVEGTPSRARFSNASGECVRRSEESWSVSRRLCSSGIDQSKLRRPASRWQTGMPSFTAASAPASVEFTSPGTTTRSGFSSTNASSSPASARAVCAPCAPEPTSSWTWGRGRGSSSKNTSLTDAS